MNKAANREVVDWRGVLHGLINEIEPRGKSLIMTVYGDAILPHGGGAWLGDLIDLLGPLGLKERVVRTSVYRLTQDGLLTARQRGRRSFYALTPSGLRQSRAASRRIYAVRPKHWDGGWTQVWLPGPRTDDGPDTLARALTRLGFAFQGPNIMLHGGPAHEAAVQTIGDWGLRDEVIVARAHVDQPGNSLVAARAHVADIWPLESLAREYDAFLRIAAPVQTALDTGSEPDAAGYLALRGLLIHAYRRIVLKDPVLAIDLLPVDWPGVRAGALMRELHGRIADKAQAHVMSSLQGETSELAAPDAEFRHRFRL